MRVSDNCIVVQVIANLRGPETRSSSLRCGFVFVDEATEQVSAPNVVEVEVDVDVGVGL